MIAAGRPYGSVPLNRAVSRGAHEAGRVVAGERPLRRRLVAGRNVQEPPLHGHPPGVLQQLLLGGHGLDGGLDDEACVGLQALAPRVAARLNVGAERRDLGVTDDLAGLPGLTGPMLVKLGQGEVKTLEDFADLASDELTDPEEGVLASFDIRESEANDMIMKARVAAGWFTEEELRAAELERLAEEERAVAEAEGGEEIAM